MSLGHEALYGTRRRRSPLACNTCRERRTKCDGQRPKCSFCVERSKDCHYPGPQDPPPSSLQMELSRIWDQLEHITGVVQRRCSEHGHFPKERLARGPQDCPGKLIGFPFMTVQNETFMEVLGLDPSLPGLLEGMERGRQTISGRSSGVPVVTVDLQRASDLLNAFAERIHIWYPILHAGYTDDFLQAVESSLPPSVGSCLTLLTLAIGCLVECETIVHALQRRPETVYIQAAVEMLPCVLTDSSLGSAQCLLLFSVYHLCYAQPCQAHDFVAMASQKLQNSVMNDLDGENDATKVAAIGNCYWSALLIESEIAVQFDLVDSGIWSTHTLAPAPASIGTWTWMDLSYFVAEIAMRKMLQRCTWSIRPVTRGRFAYAPIVAAELERQLDEWHQLLPEGLSFGRQVDSPTATTSGNCAQAEFLRTQYYAFKASIYWPAAYEALGLSTGTIEVNDDLLVHCQNFFDSYVEFTASVVVSVRVCKPNIWTLYTSVFTISMAALAALEAPCLAAVASPRVLQSLEVAVNVFASVAEISPSLATMGGILKEKASYYLLARF